MKTKAAVLTERKQPWEIMELDLRDPKEGEVLIRYVAAGLCHSDDAPDDRRSAGPAALHRRPRGRRDRRGGRPGSHPRGQAAITSSARSSRRAATAAGARPAARASVIIGATILDGCLPDGSYPFVARRPGHRRDVHARHVLAVRDDQPRTSAVKVDDDLPLEVAVLCGCGVPTGWGSAVNTGNVQIGDTVIIFGIGGIGANAVQGAAHAGATQIIAVDPLAQQARVRSGDGRHPRGRQRPSEAIELAKQNAAGGADVAIVTVDVVNEQVVQAAAMSLRKDGTLVLTGLAHPESLTVHLSGADMTLFRKHVKGSLFGDCNPTLRHQEDARPLPRRASSSSTSSSPSSTSCGDQRGLRRPRGRQEHPRGHHPRALRSCDFVLARCRRDGGGPPPRGGDPHGRARAGLPHVLDGPPGTGKSTLLRSIAGASGRGVQFVEGNAELTPARLIGSP